MKQVQHWIAQTEAHEQRNPRTGQLVEQAIPLRKLILELETIPARQYQRESRHIDTAAKTNEENIT